MPVNRIPVVHKFGIISHSQRLELQERLLKQSYLNSIQSKKPTITRPEFEVTEEFVTQYNNEHNLEDQDKFNNQAFKMLERIKRKTGLKSGGLGRHVDLPVAWTELAQLAQCKGHIQEECLNIIVTSLDQAPLHKSHIAALFYLAETTLYWLRTEAVHQPYLRTGEIKLLRMGQLTFMRLFYHHMSGHLQSHSEFKNRLFTYLDGFGECQSAYNPYPNALLSLRYINEVGKIIIGDCYTEAGELKEGDALQNDNLPEDTEIYQVGQSEDRRQTKEKKDTELQSSHSGAISSSVHDLSPTLWHALDVWRCVKHLSGGHSEALRSLGNCGMGLASESWVDVVVALHILSDAAKASLSTLRVMQNLARGIRPKTPSVSPGPVDYANDEAMQETIHSESSNKSNAIIHKLALSDIYEKSEEYNSIMNQSSDGGKNWLEKVESPKDNFHAGLNLETDASRDGNASVNQQSVSMESRNREKTEQSIISKLDSGFGYTDHTADVGTDLPSGRASDASTVPTFTNQVHPGIPGLHGWHWEAAITYCDLLADICLHGATSKIKKIALTGNNEDLSEIHKKALLPEVPISSAGLLDLVYFRASKETKDRGSNDWSWRVRYSALQGLVKICRCCVGDQTQEGMRTVAWNALLKANSLEKDLRVLEALKVGQVDANIENVIQKHLSVAPCTIGAKIAAGLAVLYLPPLPPPIEPVASTCRKPAKQIVTSHPVPKKPLRTSLKQEIQLATALYEPPVPHKVRTDFDLKRVVEDQWRKGLQKQQLEEEGDRQKQLKKKQTDEEEKQTQIEEKRKQILGNKYKGPAYYIPEHRRKDPVSSSSNG